MAQWTPVGDHYIVLVLSECLSSPRCIMGTGWGTGVAGCSRGSLNLVFVYIQEVGFHVLYGSSMSKQIKSL